MSFHVCDPWRWDQEVNDEIVQALVEAIPQNKWGDNYTPPAFGIFSIGDQLLFNIAGMIDRASSKTEAITEDIIREDVPDDFEYKEKAVEIVTRVLKGLEMFDVPLERGRVSKKEASKDLMKNYPNPSEDPDHFRRPKGKSD